MTRVLWLCEFPTLNGGERSLLAMLPALCEAGFEIACIAPPEGELTEELERQGVEFLPFDFRDAEDKKRPLKELRRKLHHLLQATRADLLHANSLSMGRLAGPVAAELKLPSIAHLRDIIGLSGQAIEDLNRHTRIIAVSAATREFHVQQGLDARRTHVLHNGVDLHAFRPEPKCGYLHSELKLPREAMLCGTIGQIIMRKGLLELAQAAQRLAVLKRLHFVIVGERYSQKREAVEHEWEIHAVFAAAGLTDRVHFLGVRNDVPRLLNEFDLLAHAARQEPLGRVLLESAASGLPVVATDVGGTAEIFPPESQAAVLVPKGDIRGLAEAIRRVVTDKNLRETTARKARGRAEAAFDIRLAAPKLAEHYAQAIEER